MGIWDRLGNVVKSYVNDGKNQIFGEKTYRESRHSTEDEDLRAAYDELDDFMKGPKAANTGNKKSGTWEERFNGEKSGSKSSQYSGSRPVPNELKEDFAELGLTLNATEAECKEAYKKLLKIHHPDRHTGNPDQMKKATEKSARINAAYDRIEKWYKIR